MRAHVLTLLLASLVSCQVYIPAPLSTTFGDVETTAVLPPLANAGADREVLRGYQTRLEGGGSYHPQARPFTYNWHQTEGEAVHLSNAASATPTFLAPLAEQVLVFQLKVDDGAWTTADEVRLHVRPAPSILAPYVLAGPDRAVGEAAEPGPGDLLETDAAQAPTWTALTPTASAAVSDTGDLAATIFRVSAERDGLRSAPDYLLLHALPVTAPALVVDGPTEAQPGTSVTLTATTEVGASLRWEQIAGLPVLTNPSGETIELLTPTRPQVLQLRIYARLGSIESAPLLHVISVESATITAPMLIPDQDVRVHEGNGVTLDADGFPEPSPSVTFVWTQTYGAALETQLSDAGRFLSFVAPAAPTEIAFAIVPVVDGDGQAVEGAPAVARVTVLDDANNTGPEIVTCWTPTAPQPGDIVKVTAWVRDPEWDGVATVTWSNDSSSLDLGSAQADQEAPCDAPETGLQHSAYRVDFTMPESSSVELSVQACDDLEACTTEAIVVD